MSVRERRARLDASGRRVAIVVSRFNDLATRRLVDGALECLAQHGAPDADVWWVAGAFELPQMAARLARAGRVDGIVCLGAIIRGETVHFDVLARAVTTALERVAVEHGVPVGLGVLTVDTLEQALERSGGKHGNAGWKAAASVVELMAQLRSVDELAT